MNTSELSDLLEIDPSAKIAQIKALRILSDFTDSPLELKDAKDEIELGQHFININTSGEETKYVGSPVQALVNYHKRNVVAT